MSMLNDSIKTPIVYIYSDRGELLTATLDDDKPMGVVDFRYKYDDQDADECVIKIQFIDHKWVDQLGITRNSILQVKWGYIGGPFSPMITIGVQDVKSKYGPNIIYKEYLCKDLTNEMRLVRAEKDIRKISIMDFLLDAGANYNIVIQSGKEVIFKRVKEKKQAGTLENSPQMYHLLPVGLTSNILVPIGNSYAPTADDGEWFNEDKWGDIKKYFTTERDIVSVNRSPFTLVEEYLNSCPYGPWFVTGRADTIFIHNRNLGGDVYKSYAYAQENGELIDFEAETKYDAFMKQVISSTRMDPNQKITSNFTAYLHSLESAKSFQEIIDAKNISDEDRLKLLKEFVNNYIAFRRYGVQPNRYDVYTEREHWDYANDRNIAYQNVTASHYAAQANSKYFVQESGKRNDSPYKYKVGTVVLYTIPVDSPEDIEHQEDNEFRKLAMESEEATILLEGDPHVKSEHILNITNVGMEHVGKYYAKTCEHEISLMGYKTTVEGCKVKDQAIVKSLKTDYDDTNRGNLKDIWEKQNRLFAKWNIRITFTKKVDQYTQVGPTGALGGTSDKYYTLEDKTLEEVFMDNTLNGDPDMIASKLKTYLDGKYDITITEDLTNTELR